MLGKSLTWGVLQCRQDSGSLKCFWGVAGPTTFSVLIWCFQRTVLCSHGSSHSAQKSWGAFAETDVFKLNNSHTSLKPRGIIRPFSIHYGTSSTWETEKVLPLPTPSLHKTHVCTGQWSWSHLGPSSILERLWHYIRCLGWGPLVWRLSEKRWSCWSHGGCVQTPELYGTGTQKYRLCSPTSAAFHWCQHWSLECRSQHCSLVREKKENYIIMIKCLSKEPTFC